MGRKREKRGYGARHVAREDGVLGRELGLLENSQLPLVTGLPDNLDGTSSRTSKARGYAGSWLEPVE